MHVAILGLPLQSFAPVTESTSQRECGQVSGGHFNPTLSKRWTDNGLTSFMELFSIVLSYPLPSVYQCVLFFLKLPSFKAGRTRVHEGAFLIPLPATILYRAGLNVGEFSPIWFKSRL